MSWMQWHIVLALITAHAMFVGCGNSEVQQQVDRAKDLVRVSLDAWKQGEKAAALKERQTPIAFYDDDWKKSVQLVDYQIDKVYMETDGSPRCAVTLKIQRDEGQSEEVQVTYQVVTKPEIVIARDPFA